MTSQRVQRILRLTVALVTLAIAMVALGLVLAGPAKAATAASPTPASAAAPGETQGSIVRFGEDVTVPAGERVDSVVAGGGDVTIDGSVKGSVVALGGDVTVRGEVGTTIVALGGDVQLLPGSVVGASMSPQDRSVVLFGGTLSQDPGARVTGVTKVYDNANWPDGLGWAAGHTIIKPWWGFTLMGWIVQTAVFLVLALVAAALMPRQLRAVQRQLSLKTAASLGWGALTFFVIVPAVLVVLIISIVGLLLVLPYVVVVPLFYFFVITAVAALIAAKVLAGTQQKDNLMLAVTLGVVGTTIVSRIPAAGTLALMVMAVFGSGAAVMAFAEWRRTRKLAATPAPAGAPPAISPTAAAVTVPATAATVAAVAEPATALMAPPEEAATAVSAPAAEAPPAVEDAAAGPPAEEQPPSEEQAPPEEPPPSEEHPAAET